MASCFSPHPFFSAPLILNTPIQNCYRLGRLSKVSKPHAQTLIHRHTIATSNQRICCNVRTVLKAVLGPSGGIGPAGMAEKLKVVYHRSINPDDDDNCALDPDERSYLAGHGDCAQIVICDRAFKRPRLSLEQTDCDLIGAVASAVTMEVIGASYCTRYCTGCLSLVRRLDFTLVTGT